MTQQFRYAVIGAGRQGTAAAYDMAKWGGAASIVMADSDAGQAARAAERVNTLTGRSVATSAQVNASDESALAKLLEGVDVFLAATPFAFLLACTRAAIHSGASMVDLGGHTATVLQQMSMSDEAKAGGVAIVPDCGMGPGMNNTMGLYTVERLQALGATPREVRLWDGGLPQNPPEPWGYQSSFHINGLTNEYDGKALVLRDGKVTHVDTLTEMEVVEFDGIGKLEAFVTSGGTSTVPYTFEGRLHVYENKTCRYPGHYAQFRAFKELGLFDEAPIAINPGTPPISPRQFYHRLLAPQVEVERVVDICVMRAKGTGEKDGRDMSVVVELVDRYDDTIGFTAMERLTGWHAAIMAEFIARGEIGPGVWPVEKAISATRFLEKVRERGFQIQERNEGIG